MVEKQVQDTNCCRSNQPSKATAGAVTAAAQTAPASSAAKTQTLDAILGTEFPLIQGGMANIATGEFAAAVCNAGAMGVIASGGISPDKLRAEIHACRKLTDRPFGVNVMLMHYQIDDIARVVAEEHVPFVTTGAGSPAPYVDSWKQAGAKVFPVVASAILAHRLERCNIDGVIAEGTESGGHVGELTSMVLVPQVVDAVSVPVVAAGGIANGRQYTAARALGAIGAQIGTCLLLSEECPIHDQYKAMLLKARESGTTVYGRLGGVPVRALKNRMTRAYVKAEKAGESKEELEKMTLGALRRAVFDGDVEHGSFMCGQVVGQLHEVRPLRAIFEDIMSGASICMDQLESAGDLR